MGGVLADNLEYDHTGNYSVAPAKGCVGQAKRG